MGPCATVAFSEGAGMTGLARIGLLVRIFRRSRQTVRAAWAGMWSNPGCESLFHPYVGVMFMPTGEATMSATGVGGSCAVAGFDRLFKIMGYSKP